MEQFLKIITDNFIVFTIISGFLVLALIGYIVELKFKKDIIVKKNKKDKNEPEELF